MYVRVYTPLLHDHLARVWRALIGTPFRIKVMDRRARVQRQALYPWDPLVCAVADIVTRERHLLIFEGTRSGSGYIVALLLYYSTSGVKGTSMLLGL